MLRAAELRDLIEKHTSS